MSRRLRWVLAPLVLAAAAAALLLLGGSPQDRPKPDLGAAVRAADARLISDDYAYGIGDHPDGRVDYRTNPPTNGPHAPVAAADGNYAGVEPPPVEQLVHAQEHGRIVVQYRPGLPAAQLAQLEALFEEDPYHVILVENRTEMPCEIAVTAWGHGLLCDTFSASALAAIRAFRDTYRDEGPEDIA